MNNPQQPILGYTDTPHIPDSRWHVHDPKRAQPPPLCSVCRAPRRAAGQPPSDAMVLFDGTSLDGWGGKDGGSARWTVENGYVEVVPKTGDVTSLAQIGDSQFHLEWPLPAEMSGSSQGRGNSATQQGVKQAQ
jgi:hypothetical protein